MVRYIWYALNNAHMKGKTWRGKIGWTQFNPSQRYLTGFTTTKTGTWGKHEWVNSSHMFSVWGPSAAISSRSHRRTSKTPPGRGFKKKNVRRYRLVSAPPRSPSQAPSASLQLFVLKLALLTSKRFLMSFSSSLYLASLLSSSAALALPLCFLLCLCYPSSLSSLALASSCLLPLQAGFNRGA